MRKSYPSDISRSQFDKILPLLEEGRKKTKPRTVDLYEVFCAITYVLKSGCQWRMLPSDFPKWTTVYAYFRRWNAEQDPCGLSVLHQALKKSGYRGSYQTGAQRQDELLYRGCTER